MISLHTSVSRQGDPMFNGTLRNIPKQDAKGPNVTAAGKHAVVKRLWRHPPATRKYLILDYFSPQQLFTTHRIGRAAAADIL
jgi:hypothetical protein